MRTNGQLRTVIYARVSKANRGGETTSVDEQLHALRLAVTKHGGTIVAEHTDRAISASDPTKTRPGWAAVVAAVETGNVDAVALWEISRSSRELSQWAGFRNLCRRQRVVWITPDAVVDPAGSRDRMSLGVKAVVAEEESVQTSDRIRRGVREKAAQGRPHGRETYGYQRVYDPATGRLTGVTVHEGEAATIRRLAIAALAGDGMRTLAHQLNTEGVPCPSEAIRARRGRPPAGQKWTGRVVKELLLSRTLLGLRTHTERDYYNRARVIDRAEHRACWPAILTAEEHERLAVILNDPARWTRRPDDGEQVVRHWLTGVLRCSKCGGPMRAGRQRRGESWQEFYACADSHCRAVTVHKASTEELVAGIIVARLSQPDARGALTMEGDDDSEVAAARERLATFESRMEELAGAYAAGDLGLKAYSMAERRLQEEIDAARARVASVAPPVGLPGWAADLTDAAGAWGSWEAPARNAVAKALFTRILVAPSGRTGRPAKGRRQVSITRLGFVRAGTVEPIWGVEGTD